MTFYHQKRRDGGLRTGVEFDGECLLERYDPGENPRDSALLWYVDVRCLGEQLPDEPEAVRQWLLERGDPIRAALRELAEELGAGMDDEWPLKKEISSANGVRMAIYCSAMRRLDGREISAVLSDLASQWQELLDKMVSYEHSLSAHG